MVQRLVSFLVVSLLMFNGEIFGQGNPISDPCSENDALTKLANTKGVRIFCIRKFTPRNSVNVTKPATEKDSVKKVNNIPNYFLLRPIAANHYSKNLGFVCKKELQLDKITTVPIRFRLGSLDYVNYLEQKPNAIKPQ